MDIPLPSDMQVAALRSGFAPLLSKLYAMLQSCKLVYIVMIR